jgi:hypothetical protein
MLPDAYGLYRSASHIKLTYKYLGFQSIRFKFHDRIKQRPISFQSVISRTAQGDNRLCASQWSMKFYPSSNNKRPRSTQVSYFWSCTRSANQHVQISQWLLIDVPNHHIFYMRSTAYKKERGFSIDTPHIFYYFQYALHRVQKARVPYVCAPIVFINQIFKSFYSSADIIIDGLALPQTSRACLLVFIRTQRNKWERDQHLLWSDISAPIGS